MRADFIVRLQAALEGLLQKTWRQRGPLSALLSPLSLLLGRVLAKRQKDYASGLKQSTRLPVPVIVVGNVIVGGAGKTPVTLAIAQHLAQKGWRVGIISRGHGRRTRGAQLVQSGSSAHDVGDEPLLLHRRSSLPVAVARERARAGLLLLQSSAPPNILLCDDGLQHLALASDIRIGVFDARGIGNARLLPAGPLREPWPRPLELLLATETPRQPLPLLPGQILHLARRQLAESAHQENGMARPLGQLPDGLTAVAGIARPQAFFSMLSAAGVKVARELALPDHFDYRRLPAILRHAEVIICTEKDAVKLWRHRPDAWAVPLALDIPEAFWRDLQNLLDRLHLPTGKTATLGQDC